MNKKISIVIRCKNEERWVGHTIQSVLDFIPGNEIIIVDNDSQDKSLEIVQQFRSNPALQENKKKYADIKILSIDKYSPGFALNQAAKVSSGDYILFLSSHCVITKFHTESILNNLKRYAAIFGDQDPVYRGQKITKRYLWSHFSNKKMDNMYSEMEQRYFFHNALSIVSKEVLLQNPFDEELVGKEDRYWATNIIENNIGNILYDPSFSCDHHYTEAGNTWKGVG
jgi:rhamnosyltransferase